jgi:hypothetical protein
LKHTSTLKIINLKHLKFIPIIAVILLLGINPEKTEASPSLVNIGVGTKGKVVVMNARLVDGFNDSIMDAIENGVPITFTFLVELRQKNNLWNDTLVSNNTINHTIQYDSLKKVYRFSESGKSVKRKIRTRNKENYQKLMLTLENIPIASTRRLTSNEKYYIRIKAKLETDHMWFPFNHLFSFLPFNNFEAAWAESSPLSINPNLAFSKNKLRNKTSRNNIKQPKEINPVVRSFNQ